MARLSRIAGPLALAALSIPRILTAHTELMSVPELAAASPHIVVAVVESRQSRWNPRHTLLVTDYVLRIEERLRGDAPDHVTITVPGGSLGRIADETCVTVHLEPGSRYLLFLGALDRPSLTPVTGASQGMFRELPGRFADLVDAVRPLAAQAFQPRPARPASAGLPAKTWDPTALPVLLQGSLPPLAAPPAAAPPPPGDGAPAIVETAGIQTARSPRPAMEKFVYQELAPAPIVINPLPEGSPFSPWDQYEMAYWNLYAGDLFRVTSTPSATWAYGNGVSDIAGFPGDAQMQAQFGTTWEDDPPGVFAITFARRVDGVITEADVVFNPNRSWTLDDLEATSASGGLPFKDAVLHELGHVWGELHAWEYQQVWWDSIMITGRSPSMRTSSTRTTPPPCVPPSHRASSSATASSAPTSPTTPTSCRSTSPPGRRWRRSAPERPSASRRPSRSRIPAPRRWRS